MSLRKQKNRDLEFFRDITDDVVESDFVPYACHYDAATLLTKNGELLQTIRILGVKPEYDGLAEADLRARLRDAVRDHIPSDAYALWFHTIRRTRDLSLPADHLSPFAAGLAEAWEEKHRFAARYVNEVYVTIVREGQDASLWRGKNFLMGLWPGWDAAWRMGRIAAMQGELDSVVERMLGALSMFRAERLEIVERQGEYFSEPCEFLEKLINLQDLPMLAPDEDLSDYLTRGEITFGFSAMEVRVEEKRRFAAILTVKEYKEASLGSIDAFLDLPVEFIVTQCVDFISPKRALENYRKQQELFLWSGDAKLSAASEVDAILASDRAHPVDFGQHQLSVFLLADTVRELEDNVRLAVASLRRRGIVAVREDLRFEECYWAQLPANFEFIARLSPTNTSHTAGFANLGHAPLGAATGNRWGEAVAVFDTLEGNPCFFSFHDRNNGHTIAVGSPESTVAALTHFLIAQATKFSPRIVYFDLSGKGEELVTALDGVSLRFSAEEEDPATLNPFGLTPDAANRDFLCRWLGMLARVAGENVDDQAKTAIRLAVDAVCDQPPQQRNFPAFLQALRARAPRMAQLFAAWNPEDVPGRMFASEKDSVCQARIERYDVEELLARPEALAPVVSCLLRRVEDTLDGSPAILVFDEAWTLLANTHATLDIRSWLTGLTAKNAICIFRTEHVEPAAEAPWTADLAREAATLLLFPAPEMEDAYRSGLGLDEREMTALQGSEERRGHFLLRHGAVAVAAAFPSGAFGDLAATLGVEEETDEKIAEEDDFSAMTGSG